MTPVDELKAGERVLRLKKQELLFNGMPLAFASYPATAFRLRRSEPDVLVSSLATALGRHWELAGRFDGDVVRTSGQGVPFTVVEDPRESAPRRLEERDLLYFADYRRSTRAAAGLEPLLTVRLTRFRDRSAVLAVCRSHALMDGTSSFAFLGDWARAARGEELVGRRGCLIEDESMPGFENEVHALWQEVIGTPLHRSHVMLTSTLRKGLMKALTPALDTGFLTGATGDLTRPHVFFSHAELEAIKAAAMPAGDGRWVSTQEALAAHIALTIGRSLLPASSRGRTAICFIMDPRKQLGKKPTETFGAGIMLLVAKFDGLLQMSLADVAWKIHEAAEEQWSQEAVRRRWRLAVGCTSLGLGFGLLYSMRPEASDYDIFLMMNNQSKRELPDFGEFGSGGRAEAVVTNAGPTLVLPAPGGVDVLLDSETILKRARTTEARTEAVAALRRALPSATC